MNTNQDHPLLSVVMPCFNERPTIEAILQAVKNVHPPQKEIIVVDDGSTDGSQAFLLENQERLGIRVIVHARNQGKGAALQSGFKAASGDIVLIQDADLEYDPQDYPRLLEPILAGKADVVYGSRFLSSNPHRVLYFWHWLGNQVLTFLSNAFTNLNLSDMETGYKVFKREIVRQLVLKEKRFGVEPEITAKIAKLNCRIYEVGIAYHGRRYEEGKKIGWRDGVRALYCILRYNLGPSR